MLTVSSLESATVCGAGSICGNYPQCDIVFTPLTCPDPTTKNEFYEPVERTLCVVLVVIICRQPPGFHTLMVSSYMLQAMTELMASQCPLIISSQESAGFTRGQFMSTSDNKIMSRLLSFNVFMTHIFFPFNLSSFNPVMLKNPSNKFSSSWNCCNSYLYMHLRLGSFSKSS